MKPLGTENKQNVFQMSVPLSLKILKRITRGYMTNTIKPKTGTHECKKASIANKFHNVMAVGMHIVHPLLTIACGAEIGQDQKNTKQEWLGYIVSPLLTIA